MLNTYRRNDAVLVVCQNNGTQRVEIAAINDQARKVMGYGNEEIVGRSLHELVEDSVKELLNDKITYVDNQEDVADALINVRNMKVLTRSGSHQEFRLRVVRSEVVDTHPMFHLVLEDERIAHESDSFKEVIKENFRGHEVLEERTGLPNRASLTKDLELFQFFAEKRETTACFAVMQLDNAAQMAAVMGAQVPFQVLKHLGQLCTQRLRNEDTVGLISGNALGLILMQITPESSRVVLNRLRWSAASMPVILDNGKRVDPEISIAFHMIGKSEPDIILKTCEEYLLTTHVEGGSLHEVRI